MNPSHRVRRPDTSPTRPVPPARPAFDDEPPPVRSAHSGGSTVLPWLLGLGAALAVGAIGLIAFVSVLVHSASRIDETRAVAAQDVRRSEAIVDEERRKAARLEGQLQSTTIALEQQRRRADLAEATAKARPLPTGDAQREVVRLQTELADARRQIDELRAAAVGAASGSSEVRNDPTYLSAEAGQVGKSFLFRVTGSTSGSVWGSDLYTTDSMLAVAAVHAGVVQPGETAVVKVTIVAGQPSYTGTLRNGVQTSSWGQYHSSFRVEKLPPNATK